MLATCQHTNPVIAMYAAYGQNLFEHTVVMIELKATD